MKLETLVAVLVSAVAIFTCGVYVGTVYHAAPDKPLSAAAVADVPPTPAAAVDEREICVPHGGWLVCMPQSMLQQKFGADACFNGNGNPVPCGGKDPREEQQ